LAGTFPISGQIDPKSFPFLVADLHRNGATGSLKVEGPTYQKALYFRGGRVLFGSSNDPRDQLGAILIEDGRITPEQLEDVNSKVGPGNPLAKVLAETGFVSQRELSDAARAKVERILSDVLGYTSGTFEFEDGVLPKGAVDLKLSTERLVLTSVRRISDRTFVLRHLEGLDVVLRPAASPSSLRSEVEAETGGLLAQLDGQATLKEARGRTRLDDFEAAKVACALLFLGAVERATPGSGEPVLDLGDTAREAFGEEWTAPPPEPAPPPPPPARRRVGDDTILDWGRIDPKAFAREEPPSATAGDKPSAAAASAPAPLDIVVAPDRVPAPPPPPPVAAPAPVAAAPVRTVTPPPARVAAPPPVPMPEPDPPTVRVAEPEPPPVPAPPARPTITPSREWTPPSRTPPAPRAPVASTRPPSKDDLAALDALLDPRTLEGPLEPLERAPEPRWTPPDRSVRARRSESPGFKRIALYGGFLVVAAAIGFGVVWYLRQPAGAALGNGSDPVPPSPTATTLAAVTPDTLPPMVPMATPVATPAVVRATPAPATPAPTVAPTAAPRATAGGGLAAARGQLRQGQLDDAARGFAAHLRSAPAPTASIQLLVACAPETVQKAVAAVDAAELFILPVSFKGRDCYRMCWGLYESSANASSSVRSLPEYFVKGGATPRVMTRAELLP
jgi:hypothetical protein